jgi:hypothetical protein
VAETDFPAAPRRVRLRAACRLWWPFGLAVGLIWLLTTLAALALLAADGFCLPFSDWALDRQAVVAARPAAVESSEPTSTHLVSQSVHRVRYSFDLGDGSRTGLCYTLGPRLMQGQDAAVEYLPEDRDLHRLRGSVRAESALWAPWLGWIWLPLTFLLGFWGSRVYRLRVLLRNGRAAEALLVAASRTGIVNPPQLKVRYRFADGAGGEHEGRHWVRAGSPLGRRIAGLQPGDPIPGSAVVYDEADPDKNRLCAREDASAEA